MSYPAVMAGRAAPLRAYWRLGEADGTQRADSSGNGNGSTTGNLISRVAGFLLEDSNQALQITGGGGYIGFPDSATLRPPDEYSVSCIYRPTTIAAGSDFLMGKMGSTGITLYLYRSGAALLFGGFEPVTVGYVYGQTGNVLVANTSVHIVATIKRNPFAVVIYLNGNQVGISVPAAGMTNLGAWQQAATPFYLGGYTSTNTSAATFQIDEAAMFTGILSASDALALYLELRSRYAGLTTSGDSDLALGSVREKLGALVASGESDLAMSAVREKLALISYLGESDLALSAIREQPSGLSVAADSGFAADSVKELPAGLPMGGDGTFSADGVRERFSELTLTSEGELVLGGIKEVVGQAILSGDGDLALGSVKEVLAGLPLGGVGDLALQGITEKLASLGVSGESNLALLGEVYRLLTPENPIVDLGRFRCVAEVEEAATEAALARPLAAVADEENPTEALVSRPASEAT